MQSATTANETLALVPANMLREMTVTKEDIFNRQKENILEQLMSAMTRVATEKGGTQYGAQLTPNFDPALQVEIVNAFQGLGYSVSTETKTDEKIGTFNIITISWAQ